jgi:thermitase
MEPPLETDAGNVESVPGQLIVVAKTPELLPIVEALISRQSAARPGVIQEIRGLGAVLVKVPEDQLLALANTLSLDGNVAYAGPNHVIRIETFTPNDPLFSSQYAPQTIQAPEAWQKEQGSKGTLVAIADTGIDYTHPDLSRNFVSLGYDWVNDDPDPRDDNSHGTHVAGIVAAELNNGLGVAGIAQVGIMAEKVCDAFGGCPVFAIAEGIIHATARGARTINMSFGGPVDDPLVKAATRFAFNNGVLLVASMGNSNTNHNVDPLFPSDYPWVIGVSATSCPVGYLADPACIGVDVRTPWSDYGSTADLAAPGEDVLSTFPFYFGLAGLNAGVIQEIVPSARSFTHTISKGSPSGDTGVKQIVSGGLCRVGDVPTASGELVLCERGGVDFRAMVLNAYAQGAVGVIIYNNLAGLVVPFTGETPIPSTMVSQADGEALLADMQAGTTTARIVVYPNTDPYAFSSGTSMSAPFVTGVAALIFSHNPILNNTDVRQILRSTATDLGEPGFDPFFGFGRVNAYNSLLRTPSSPSPAPVGGEVLYAPNLPLVGLASGILVAGVVTAGAAIALRRRHNLH